MRLDSVIALKPHDVAVLLKIITLEDQSWSQAQLGKELSVSSASINEALKRTNACGLYNPRRLIVSTQALAEFLTHGIRYAFPAVRGKIVRGIPTAAAAEPLNKIMSEEALSWPPVWSSPNGTVQGYEIIPIMVAIHDVPQHSSFYQLLALTDALREGRVREKEIAAEEVQKRFASYRTIVHKR